MVIADIRIEIRPSRLDHDLAQQANVGELVQRVVDRRERYPHLLGERLLVQLLGRHVAVAGAEQQPGQRDPLPSRTQRRGLQTQQDRGAQAFVHGRNIVRCD